MIEINLIPGKKKKASGGGLTLPDFSELAKSVRDPLLVGAIAAWAIVLPAVGFIFFTENGKAAKLEYHGSAHINALCQADGLLRIPAGTAQIEEGATIAVRQI